MLILNMILKIFFSLSLSWWLFDKIISDRIIDPLIMGICIHIIIESNNQFFLII